MHGENLKLPDMTTVDTAIGPICKKTSNFCIFDPEGSNPIFKAQEFLDY